ncbi:MAG: FAD:protein FMN transferase [Halanaerobiales bacterium]|nr:FAD:protein FMN transferase [Halanaerobiales bacterium]
MSFKKFFFALIIIIIIISGMYIISGNQKETKQDLNNSDNQITKSEGSEFLMDTLIRIRIHDENSKQILEEAFNKVRFLENLLSKTNPESDISNINNNAKIKYVSVEDETYELLKEAKYFSNLTNGAFDPSIGPLVKLWGIGTEDQKIPSDEEIQKALELINYKNIIFAEDNKVMLSEDSMMIDLGAIAKGFAADYLIKYFKEENVESAFINMGGNVSVHGKKIDGSDWKVGIQDPDQSRGNIIAVVEGSDISVVTSGNYERYFTEDGIRYHHILNPETGYPAWNKIISSTIISSDSSYADALSTSLYILGVEKSFDLIKEFDHIYIVLVTEDNMIYASKELKEITTFTDDRFTVQYR